MTSAKCWKQDQGRRFRRENTSRKDPRVELSVAIDLDIEGCTKPAAVTPALCLVVADLCNLPFRAEAMNLSWNGGAVGTFVPQDPSSAVAEMARVTRKGGSVFVGSRTSTDRWDSSLRSERPIRASRWTDLQRGSGFTEKC